VLLHVAKFGVVREPDEGTAAHIWQLLRRDGDWEAWLAFFLEGVSRSADGAVSTARRLEALFLKDREKIVPRGRRAGSALRVHDALKARPVASMQAVRARTGLSFPGTTSAMKLLVDLGIARELTGRRRNRVFVYDRYLKILSEGTEAP
jgi:Fic family protein